MDTLQILKILKRNIGEACLGVFPSDRLPKSMPKSSAIVVNTDPSDKPGTHWVAIFKNVDGTVDYFDSYGFKPMVATISHFLNKFKKCHYNMKRIQGILSSVCGHYCIYFVMQRWKNNSMEEIVTKFSENGEENDEMITEWVNGNFQLDTETYDVEYIVNQICQALNKI